MEKLSSGGTSATDLLGYQKQLLERKPSLSRSNSRSGTIFPPSGPSSVGAAATRKWTPGHRTGQSVDAARSKWEEKIARQASPERVPGPQPQPSSPTRIAQVTNIPPTSSLNSQPPSAYTSRPTPLLQTANDTNDPDRTPRRKFEPPSALRYKSLPLTPVTNLNSSLPSLPDRRIAASGSMMDRTSPERAIRNEPTSPFKTPSYTSSAPLTPNDTGSSMLSRSDSTTSTSSLRRVDTIRSKWEERERELALAEKNNKEDTLPPLFRRSSVVSSVPNSLTDVISRTTPSPTHKPPSPLKSTFSPSSTVGSRKAQWELPVAREDPSQKMDVKKTPTAFKRHTLSTPISKPIFTEPAPNDTYNAIAPDSPGTPFATPAPHQIRLSTSTDLGSSSVSAVKRLGNFAIPSPSHASKPEQNPIQAYQLDDEYKPPPLSPSASSIMYPKPYKSSAQKYGSSLTDGRRLGRHLPRIASGDHNAEEEERPLERRAAQRRRRMQEASEELVIPGITGATDVSGIPGRLRLSRAARASIPAPLPSQRLGIGLWADVQRNLLQAYEYLCHVGEAQQWIEGCLGQELGFGVVEMEEGLRDGIVLAKLVRAFKGDAAVKRIYEAKKLDYRHSDNINHFLLFVRDEGLPECFIFETLDLYEKKNFPKVIYSIHALSHLLARRGQAERIGNLLGQLKFSDDQLQQTQRGLEHSGLPLPNFSSVGRELAKEIHAEPEVEVETEDERRDRLLLENETSIISLQAQARAYTCRKHHTTQKARLRLAEPNVQALQARCRAALLRTHVRHHRQQRTSLARMAIKLQAAARGCLARRNVATQLRQLRTRTQCIVKIQAQARAVLQRRRYARLKAALKSCKFTVAKLQTLSRAKLAKRSHQEMKKSLDTPVIVHAVVGLQAVTRGVLQRRREAKRKQLLVRALPSFTALQAQARGVLARRRIRTQLAKLTDVADIVIRIQAAARAYMAGKRLLNLIRGLRKATPATIGLQTRARAALARRKHKDMCKSLAEVKVVQSVGGFQALARAALTRHRRKEQVKRLEFCTPDVKGFQATSRGYIARRQYWTWRNHLHDSLGAVVLLQRLLRGVMQRRKFLSKMAYYRENLSKVVKIQSLMRAKDTREQYRRLTLGQNVNVSTIKNFVHLLDDSEADFKEEIEVEKLRERLVKNIRENQALETDVSELDVKIALVVQNVKSFEELIKARRRHGADSAAAHAARASVLAAHGDPFAGPNTLDHSTKRKLELYKQLFYLLQTRSEYLARLFFALSKVDVPDKTKRLSERVVLSLFGYGQNRREDYLLLKFFQHAIHEEVDAAASAVALSQGYPMYMNIAVQYVRPKQVPYVRESFQNIIREVIDQDDLDLETDPAALHRNRVNVEEMRSGKVSTVPKDVSFHEAIEDYFPETRGEYIRNLQRLQALTKAFVNAIVTSTKRMPYGMRYIAHETLASLREKFPHENPEVLAACVGRLIYYRFINTAIVTPETFEIVHNTIGPVQRKNLAAISKLLTQIASGELFNDDQIALVPLNDYVAYAIKQLSSWFLEVADVPEPEVHLDAYEFLDVAVQPKPILISPNEVYSMHRLIMQQIQAVAPRRDDALRVIINELDGVPHLGSDELNEARDRAINLELTNRFAEVEDPQAAEKALWVQSKRSVLAILRVQPAKDLIESLMQPVADEHETIWEEIVEHDLMADELRYHERRMPSMGGDVAYRLEDIQSLSFREVKAHAISCLLKLEKSGKVTRADGYQGILDAIAGDVRSKHRKRLERHKEMESIHEALAHLAERKKFYLEQIDSYNNYVEAAMQTMQRGKGKKRFVMPFTKQYFHLRDLQRSGQTPQFGSFKYSAMDLYDKGILLSIDQYSPRQFDRIDVVLSSNKTGIFSFEIHNTHLGGGLNQAVSTDIRLDDLLQAQFENKVSLALFNGMAKVNVNLLLYQINKKFYV